MLLTKYRALSKREQRVLRRALGMVLLVRCALFLMPFRQLHSLLIRRAGKGRGSDSGTSGECDSGRFRGNAEPLAWAVATVSRLVPAATCLTQALALQALLGRSGERSTLHVGFLRESTGEVRGHAWLEWRGRVLIGGNSSSAFTRLIALDG